MSEIRLNSSKLGTKEYWNNFYKREITNFENDSDDTGECWFDDSGAESKMVQFLIDQLEDGSLPFVDKKDVSIIDLGTGNGHLLFELHDELEECDLEHTFHFKGVDYSPESVEFAKSIQSKKQYSNFSFEQVDLLSQSAFLQNKFDVILDKGTLDAIALNNEPLDQFGGKIGMHAYTGQVQQLMNDKSVFLITSCNFTEEELVKIITEDGTNELKVWKKINYPQFKFGGVQGSTICSIAFTKNQ